MATIMPPSELCRKAVAWIDAARRDHPERPLARIVEEAAMRFNLGPKDVEFVNRLLKDPGAVCG
ncbi:MAG: hypothetical protein AB7D57_08860 [Desulfovibrionaceae bacterium]